MTTRNWQSTYRTWACVLLVLIISVILIWALLSMPTTSKGLSSLVAGNLENSGVSAEVTAILLNFRGYDTLLEVAVLLAALLSVWNLGEMHLPKQFQPTGLIMESLIRLLVPLMILVTGYVLWLGGHAAGGAFQAGALLASAGVLLLITNSSHFKLRNNLLLRFIIIAGPLVFTLIALAVMYSGGALLEYPKKICRTFNFNN